MSRSIDDVTWPVLTDRLTLRRPRAGDAEATYEYRRVPEVADWLTVLPTDPVAWAERFAGSDVQGTTVILERDDEVVGELSIQVHDGWSQKEVEEQASHVEAEVGWVIAPAYQGRGYATEAARAALEICFERLSLRRVTAGCFVENEASWRIMEKIGMRREHHSRSDGLHRTRGWLDGYQYALLAEEWQSLRSAESG